MASSDIIIPRWTILAAIAAALLSSVLAGAAHAALLQYDFRPLYTTVDDPANHVVNNDLDGVWDLLVTRTDGTFRGTATLLPTGRHILTVAHVVTDDNGVFNTNSATITLDQPYSISGYHVHPDWNGGIFHGYDLAVLELDDFVSAGVTRYDIDRNPADDVGVVGEKIGYGRSGTGLTGDTLPSGTKRSGFNLYDSDHDRMMMALGETDYFAGSVLQYDFDNGLAANDAFDFFFGDSDLGLGIDEVLSAPGDSGGPTIVDGLITGVTSYGVTLSSTGNSSDIDNELNSTFGEFAGDTRVSFFTDFIDDATTVPVPGAAWLLASGLITLLWQRRTSR